tara:strand:+ start:668 stop:847 length:180 start_codon:yes stop_codon:yes gene_type:complete
MEIDDLEPVLKSKPVDFETLSISELQAYIDQLELEIKKCKKYIESKNRDRELAENIFKK